MLYWTWKTDSELYGCYRRFQCRSDNYEGRLPFSRMASYQKDSIIYQFVLHYAGIYFWNKKFDIEFDGNTQCNIPPEDILDIIQYDKEIDY